MTRNDLATIARIEIGEDLAALASVLVECVKFIAARDQFDPNQRLTDADRQELTRILAVATKLRNIAIDTRNKQS